jgi:Stress responsive A/B Barrel Domain
MLKHVVLLKFKAEITEAEIDRMIDGLAGLPDQIEEIREFVFGRDTLHTERSYDFALVSMFDDLEAMQRYQVHPEHQKVLSHIKSLCAGIVAADFTC